jgi:GntR family transcriptional regulator
LRVTGLDVRPLDQGDPTPLWAQLASELRRRLAAGGFEDRFPTEAELVLAYRVSRATVRESIRRLRSEGLLDARRGKGTFLVRRELDAPVLGTTALASAIAAAGFSEASRVLRLEEAPAAEAAAPLGVAPATAVVWVERLRLADLEPVALDRSALAIGPGARRQLLGGKVDLAHGSLYELLSERCGVRVTGGREWLRGGTGTAAERRLLRLGRGEGLVEIERIAHSAEAPVEWRRTLVRGDRYVLSATWGGPPPGSPAGGGAGGA